ncbi:unnamed protein product [Didymodactylos carnosus]|uniref:Uncharacterized protein n=1 Tax=Didymodactylos carnosus TaxID=1234261 RepID=A0A8S2EWR1_9BILA|nr:unnamed protein product [Didymodactylos carnosus]CAF4130246.1 unnamed protein product [Didymodactylos carnosus]
MDSRYRFSTHLTSPHQDLGQTYTSRYYHRPVLSTPHHRLPRYSMATPSPSHLFTYQHQIPRHRFLSAWDLAPNPTIYLSTQSIGQPTSSTHHHNSSSNVRDNQNLLSGFHQNQSQQPLLTNNGK